jgi:hypothetical protein
MSIEPATLRTVAAAAKALPFSEPALRAKIDRGELQVVRIAGSVFLEESELRTKFGDLYQPIPTT